MRPFDQSPAQSTKPACELRLLCGDWHLFRRIEDHRQGQCFEAKGQATFTRADQDLIYAEDLTLTMPGQAPMRATRRYLWRMAGQNRFDVCFEDGRFFHRVDLRREIWNATHDCPPDQYGVRYDFSSWPRWAARWRVSGPRKSYVSDSTYWPCGR